MRSIFNSLLPLKPYRSEILLKALAPEIRSAWLQLTRSPHWAALTKEVRQATRPGYRPMSVDLQSDAITVVPSSAATTGDLNDLFKKLVPWRVGPYQVGDCLIDAEWRSPLKWARLSPIIGDLAGMRVADVGCSSGYFLFKLASAGSSLVVGFDPVERCWLQFSLLQALTQVSKIAFVPTGISTLDTFPQFFDLVICMGVIYHQRDPFSACKKLFAATKPGGKIVLESLVIPEAGSHLLIPKERYAKMRNAWIVPTPEALASLITRAGFSDARIHTFGPITTSEQRRTEWAPYESLADFLDPNDISKTIEGYPAPHSALVVARKE